jgi:ADP-heptose:LPS heptosyltransferase
VRRLAFPGFTRVANAHLLAPYALLAREAARLRREAYDLAVVFRPDHWWGALLALAAGIPVRVGAATPETTPLLTDTLDVQAAGHATEQARAIARLALEGCGVPAREPPDVQLFTLSAATRAEASDLWRRMGLDERRVVAIQPNAGVPLKSWPIDRWAALGDALLARGQSVLVLGAPADRDAVAAIVAGMRHTGANVAVGQSLDVSAGLYERCAVLVGPDSGAAHLAAALGTPTVRLYGPAPPAVFGPWPAAPEQHVLQTTQLGCVPCGFLEAPPCRATCLPACMLALSVDEVLNTIEAQLGQG